MTWMAISMMTSVLLTLKQNLQKVMTHSTALANKAYAISLSTGAQQHDEARAVALCADVRHGERVAAVVVVVRVPMGGDDVDVDVILDAGQIQHALVQTAAATTLFQQVETCMVRALLVLVLLRIGTTKPVGVVAALPEHA